MGNSNQLLGLMFCFGMTEDYRHTQKTGLYNAFLGDQPEGVGPDSPLTPLSQIL